MLVSANFQNNLFQKSSENYIHPPSIINATVLYNTGFKRFIFRTSLFSVLFHAYRLFLIV